MLHCFRRLLYIRVSLLPPFSVRIIRFYITANGDLQIHDIIFRASFLCAIIIIASSSHYAHWLAFMPAFSSASPIPRDYFDHAASSVYADGCRLHAAPPACWPAMTSASITTSQIPHVLPLLFASARGDPRHQNREAMARHRLFADIDKYHVSLMISAFHDIAHRRQQGYFSRL